MSAQNRALARLRAVFAKPWWQVTSQDLVDALCAVETLMPLIERAVAGAGADATTTTTAITPEGSA